MIRTFRLSTLILATLVLCFLLVTPMGCDCNGEPIVPRAPDAQPGDGGEDDSVSAQELVDLTWALADPEGDVENLETGATTSDYPELDLTHIEFSIDEETEEFVAKFTCLAEPAKDEFVSGYFALVDDTTDYRPVGDPFAALSVYLYFWKMNDDTYAAVIEQKNGEAVILDESVEIIVEQSMYELRSAYYRQGLEYYLKESTQRIVLGTTDGSDNSDWILGMRIIP